MPVSGTLLNVLTVLVGGTLGLLLGGRLPERFQGIIFNGLGLATLLIGMQNALTTGNILVLLGGILIGGLIGEWLRLDYHLDNLGTYLQKRLAGNSDRKGSATFSEAFVTSSLIFCVGPLTILGSIQNGISGDITFLAIKSMLDGFAAFAFAASLGWGVLVSSVTVLVYQGALSLIAWLAMSGVPSRDNPYIIEMTAAGGLIILGVGLRLLNIKELKLANYLPALAVAPAIVWVLEHWPG
ncbi:MAG: DUF554 domain-containing protein [Chloroflexota bacterium]|nr:DUF554 domain-containing protein [Chloroflexota bacterium]MDQ5865040.1 DUF554 domain-containing protein [Chloroflexota bacterium]